MLLILIGLLRQDVVDRHVRLSGVHHLERRNSRAIDGGGSVSEQDVVDHFVPVRVLSVHLHTQPLRQVAVEAFYCSVGRRRVRRRADLLDAHRIQELSQFGGNKPAVAQHLGWRTEAGNVFLQALYRLERCVPRLEKLGATC